MGVEVVVWVGVLHDPASSSVCLSPEVSPQRHKEFGAMVLIPR